VICIKIIVGLSCLLKYVYLILFFSHLICEFFHFLAFGFSHYICVQSLDLTGTHIFHYIHDEEKMVSMMLCKMFLHLF
jgi:hypothetical protein